MRSLRGATETLAHRVVATIDDLRCIDRFGRARNNFDATAVPGSTNPPNTLRGALLRLDNRITINNGHGNIVNDLFHGFTIYFLENAPFAHPNYLGGRTNERNNHRYHCRRRAV